MVMKKYTIDELVDTKLNRKFYLQDAVAVAKKLIGKLLVRVDGDKVFICTITETEAYAGPEDKACHAYMNKKTKRTKVMFDRGGCAYIYMIYGMYHCFNIVTNKESIPHAVLIRSVKSVDGSLSPTSTNGPGKLCKALNIDKSLNGYDLVSGNEIFISDEKKKDNLKILSGKRINIDYAEEYQKKLWRFYV